MLEPWQSWREVAAPQRQVALQPRQHHWAAATGTCSSCAGLKAILSAGCRANAMLA